MTNGTDNLIQTRFLVIAMLVAMLALIACGAGGAANLTRYQIDGDTQGVRQNQKGWIARADANFNGPCDKLAAAKP